MRLGEEWGRKGESGRGERDGGRVRERGEQVSNVVLEGTVLFDRVLVGVEIQLLWEK